MSEVRRATLMPFGGGEPAADGAKKRRTEPHSVRLAFVLPESTESTCPVYNYKEELTAAKKRDKCKLQNGKTTANGLDPFDEEDDDVKRIAMEMEAKYGTGPPSKKKRKNRRDDYADIGMGYDESDSFIDNTDGYDEMIPQNVTTLHGGFYINCGALEFKADEGVSSDLSSNSSDSSTSSEDEDDDAESKAANKSAAGNRKRILESSESDGENEADKTEKKPKPGTVTNGLALKKRKEGNAEDNRKALENHRDKPPHKKSSQPSVSGASGASGDESKKKLVKDLSKDKRDEPMPLVSVNPAQQLIVSTVGGEPVKDSKFKHVVELAASGERKQSEKRDSAGTAAVSVAAERPGDISRDKVPTGKDLQLPANLPPNISDLIKRIKDNVQRNKDSNRDLFSGPVNNLLISFERKSKVLGKQSRSRIYQNIAAVLKMEKENLCKRAKNLVTSEDTRRLASLLSELQAKVAVLMVPLREVHERESQKVMSMKASDPEESKNVRMPKRKFQWTDETRKMLREIVIIKKRLLIYEGKTKESIEIHLNLFIKSDVQVLWPEGWMTMAALFKLCSSFEKKQPGLNTSQELNTTAESVAMPPPPVKSASSAPNQKVKEKKDIEKKLIDARLKEAIPTAKILSTKEMQKFQANSVSITPILTDLPPISSLGQKTKVLKASNDLLPNKIEGLPAFEPPRGLSISQIPPAAHKSTIQARNILKPEKQVTPPPAGDRQTKFVNLAQAQTDSTPAPENLTKRMSTDYNIDSIMSRKPESAAAVSSAKRQSIDIIIPKEELADGSSMSSVARIGTKVPIENFMPRPIVMDVIKAEAEDDVIVLCDDSEDAPTNVSKSATCLSTSSGEMRRKPGPKSKTKFVDTASIKTAKSASSGGTIGLPTASSTTDKTLLKPEAPPKEKKDSKNDGDDILKLMENLKELNKMTTPPSKSVDTSPASAVSVIAFNKSFAKPPPPTTTAPTPAGSANKPHDKTKPSEYAGGLTFNDVYQRHYLNSLTATPATTSTPATSTPKTYNSAHTSSSSAAPEKHYNSNNNYTAAPGQPAAKYKNNYQQHTGTYNLMDDMLANFITEYPYPKTANHKQKPTQK